MKKGWETKTLDRISTNLDSRRVPITKGVRESGEYPYYGASGIVDYVADYIFDEDALLISEDGANLLARSTPIAFPASGRYWVNNHAHILKFESLTTQRFVELYLESIPLDDYITGAAQPKLNQRALNSIPIPVPPLSEQQRIVGILDKAFAGLAVAVANAEKNLQNARALFESHLQSVFTQRGEGWEERRLGDEALLEIIDGDRSVNYPNGSDFQEEGYCLFMNTKNVRPDGFEFESTMFITEEKDRLLRKGKLKRDDVVLTTRGTIGNVGIYSEDVPFDNIRINSGMLILRPNKRTLVPSFLFEMFRSKIVKDQIRKQTTGAAQPQLPIKTLVNFSIPVPTNVAEQAALVRRLRSFEPETQRLAAIYEKKLAALLELKKSLLHQAFSGEL